MRELKFRVWKKDQQRWKNHSYKFDNCLNVYDNSGNPISERDEIELIFQQYTGLKDKNSKEIYEGDIIKLFNGNLHKVEFIEESNEVEMSGYFFSSFGCEVIGNIFENPELLKQ